MAEIFKEQPSVADLAIDATHLARAWSHLDDAGATEQIDSVTKQLDAIATQCARLETKSAIGALFQLELIYDYAQVLKSWVPDDSEGAETCRKVLLDITWMAYSIASFIEATTGVKLEDVGAGYYMSHIYNPHKMGGT